MVDESASGRLNFYFMGMQMANWAKKQSIESCRWVFCVAVFELLDSNVSPMSLMTIVRNSENRNPFCL